MNLCRTLNLTFQGSSRSQRLNMATRRRIENACTQAEEGDWSALELEFEAENTGGLDLKKAIPNLPELARRNYLLAADIVTETAQRYQSMAKFGGFLRVLAWKTTKMVDIKERRKQRARMELDNKKERIKKKLHELSQTRAEKNRAVRICALEKEKKGN